MINDDEILARFQHRMAQRNRDARAAEKAGPEAMRDFMRGEKEWQRGVRADLASALEQVKDADVRLSLERALRALSDGARQVVERLQGQGYRDEDIRERLKELFSDDTPPSTALQ